MPTRLLRVCLVAMLGFSAAHAQQTELPDGQTQARLYEQEVAAHIDVVAAIAQMKARDQYARKVLMRFFEGNDFSIDERIEFEESFRPFLEAIDDENVAALRPILKRYSWQALADIDPSLVTQAYSIVQHGPLDLQKASVEQIRPLVADGLVPSYAYVNMYDRIAESEDRPQRYGSQTICVDGQFVLYKYEGTPEELDARRSEMDLGPAQPYIDQMNERYNGCGNK